MYFRERERERERCRENKGGTGESCTIKIFITVSHCTNIKRIIRADHVARVKYR